MRKEARKPRVEVVHHRGTEDFDEWTLKVEGSDTEYVVSSWYDPETGECVLTIVIDGAIDFEEYYRTEQQGRKAIKEAMKLYPELEEFLMTLTFR